MTAIEHGSAYAKAAPGKPVDVHISDERDGSRFRALLQHYLGQAAPNSGPEATNQGKTGLSDKIVGRATELASEIKKDHVHVAKMLETAASTGDQMQLMQAMLALNDYEMRVQFVSKTISKAGTSVDQLTRMQ